MSTQFPTPHPEHLEQIRAVFGHPDADRTAIQRWIDTMRTLPEERHTTGEMIRTHKTVDSMNVQRDKPCMCAMGVQVVLAKGLDPETVTVEQVLDLKLAHAGQAVMMRSLIPTIDVDDTISSGRDKTLVDDFYWAIVYMNDAPLHWPFTKIADTLQEQLDHVS